MQRVAGRRADDARIAVVMRVNQLKAAIDAQFAELKTQFADVRAQLEAMDRRITSEATATRRHFDVVAEDLKSDIRLLAGAVAAISSTLERHINTSLSERRTVFGALDNHDVRLVALERGRA